MSKLSKQVDSKFVVVTGATRGLGRALVDELIALGQTVAGCGRSIKEIASLAKTHGAPHRFAVCDVADSLAVERWSAEILEANGPPDLLVNNAAVINQNSPLWEVPVSQFGNIVDVNIKGVFHVVRAFLPAMIERGTGVVVNLSSGWGRTTAPEVAPYCATKWAIEGMTRALAQELPTGLAAIPLNPGIIDTDMLRSCFGGSSTDYPDANQWAKVAAAFLLKLGVADNGRPLSVPGF